MVKVNITHITKGSDPGTTIIDYRVENHGSAPIWLVDDGWLVWRQQGSDVELSYARAALQPGVEVYGYFNPEVVKIKPNTHVVRHIELSCPLALSRIWNTDSEVMLPQGVYDITIRIGYGLTREPQKPVLGESVETPVLRWQKEAKSSPARMQIG